jgi:hypothetical protein
MRRWNPVSTRKAPEFCTACKEYGTKLRSLSTWREFRLPITKHQPEIDARRSNCLSEQKIIFRNSRSGKRRKAAVKRFSKLRPPVSRDHHRSSILTARVKAASL